MTNLEKYIMPLFQDKGNESILDLSADQVCELSQKYVLPQYEINCQIISCFICNKLYEKWLYEEANDNTTINNVKMPKWRTELVDDMRFIEYLHNRVKEKCNDKL